MTVQELIDELQRCDPAKEVRFTFVGDIDCGSEDCNYSTYVEEDLVVEDVKEHIDRVELA